MILKSGVGSLIGAACVHALHSQTFPVPRSGASCAIEPWQKRAEDSKVCSYLSTSALAVYFPQRCAKQRNSHRRQDLPSSTNCHLRTEQQS